MKIAFCTGWDKDKDGITDYSKQLCKAMRDIDIDLDILRLDFNIADKGYYRALAASANKADICHVQFNYVYFNGELPYRNRFLEFSKHLRVPLVMTCHEVRIGFKRTSGGFNRKLNRIIFNSTLPLWNWWSVSFHRHMYAQAALIIVHTGAQASMIKRMVRDPGRVVVVPHGIPVIPASELSVSGESAKQSMGLAGKIVLSIFGFINARKGYEAMLEILPQLPPEIVLLIAGGKMTDNATDRGYEEMLRRNISDRHLENRVMITGYLDPGKIPEAMAAADICLAPVSSEAGSGALSLCIAYRKPVIASDTGVNRELNSRIPCLELFHEGAPLLATIKELIADNNRKNELIRLARDYSERYSYGAIAQETMRLYKQISTG
jgi:glycosyltransferase involved in cell wall biosynthesis